MSLLPSFDDLLKAEEYLNEAQSAINNLKYCSRATKLQKTSCDSICGIQFEDDLNTCDPLDYCCEKPFYTQDQLDNHKSNHVKCNVSNCCFIGDSESLQLHKSLHESGVFLKISTDDSTEAVKKWIKDRRRYYPTLEKIEAKKREMDAKIARGEVLLTQEFGFKKHPSSLKRTREYKTENIKNNNTRLTFAHAKKEVSFAKETKSPSYFFSNCSEINSEPDIVDSESEDVFNKDFNPLGLACYNSEVEEDQEQQIGKSSTPTSLEPIKLGLNATYIKRPRLNAEERRNKSHDPFSSHPIVKLQKERTRCMKHLNTMHKRPRLLQMLLADEIRRERNQIMQCVRYIVENNFFDE